MQTHPQTSRGVAKRHSDWEGITQVSTIGRATLQTVPNYRLLKAATRAEASPAARLLLVHLIGYLGVDQTEDPSTRFVVFPGNTRLADELHYSTRSIQRLADELEANGLLRRCYNGLNRRTGFDLTPLAMRHESIEASIVAVHTQRKMEREQLQLELSLTADRVRRPETVAPDSTSQGDNPVIHNSPNHQDSAEKALSVVLDSVDQSLTDKLAGVTDANQDRTENSEALAEANILRQLTGSGRAGHLGWALAKKTFGFKRALSLLTIAHEDPKRKASTDRYFGWLVRMAMTNDGHAIVGQAAGRVAKKAANNPASRIISSAEEVTPESGEATNVTKIRKAIFEEVGAAHYQAWITKVSLSLEGQTLTIRTPSPFQARYVEDHFGMTITAAAQAAVNSQDLKVQYRVA